MSEPEIGPGEEPTPTPAPAPPPAAPTPPPPAVAPYAAAPYGGYGPPPGYASPAYTQPAPPAQPRPRWLFPALLGVAGLIVGLLIGGFGVAAIDRGHGGFGPRVGRPAYMQPGPFRNGPRPGGRFGRPGPAPTAKPSPTTTG
jgi:translation initiation factor IF-2